MNKDLTNFSDNRNNQNDDIKIPVYYTQELSRYKFEAAVINKFCRDHKCKLVFHSIIGSTMSTHILIYEKL